MTSMTSSAYKSRVEDIAPKNTVPPLENGDRLTQAEFERRYDAMPHLKKAELIEGIIYMASPLRIRQHGNPHARIVTWSEIFPGLWLDKEALLAGNLAKVIEIVQQGLTTVEHRNFVKQLSDRKE